MVGDLDATLKDLVLVNSQILIEADRRWSNLLCPGGVGLDRSIRNA